MSRTPLLHLIRRMVTEVGVARDTGRPVDEIADEMKERRVSRRRFLAGAATAAAAASLPLMSFGGKGGGGKPGGGTTAKVAIIGAGVAGLAAALRMKDAGVTATIYEAQTRVGGRMLTERSDAVASCGLCHTARRSGAVGWADGQWADVFGEFIDTSHATMRNLASRFNLPLIDLPAFEPAGSTDTYHFFGQYYPYSQAVADFGPVYTALQADIKAAGYPTTYASSTAAGRALDNMSVYQWIETRVPGGHSSPMGRLLDAAYVIEYGADTVNQSSLNLLYLLAYQPKPVTFAEFGVSDERFRIVGGSDLLTTAMANDIGWNNIKLGQRLDSIVKNSDGTVNLYFRNQSAPVKAEKVLLALPFTALRTIDYSKAGFDALKVKAITEQGAAFNGKLQLQFSTRYWNQSGPWGVSSGNVYSDNGCLCMWDGSRGMNGASAILVNYTGGSVTEGMALKHPYGNQGDNEVQQDAATFLGQAELIFPGISAQWNGKVINSKAHLSPDYLSAYGNYLPGQYQSICQYERVRQGNIFFAGEHTSLDFFGFMEGAASEGWAAAAEILTAMGVKFVASGRRLASRTA
jgi:monoamine oxidase